MIYCLMMCWIEKKVSSSRSLNCLFFINIMLNSVASICDRDRGRLPKYRCLRLVL